MNELLSVRDKIANEYGGIKKLEQTLTPTEQEVILNSATPASPAIPSKSVQDAIKDGSIFKFGTTLVYPGAGIAEPGKGPSQDIFNRAYRQYEKTLQ